MQKLTGISSGKNNKSCGIIHNEPKKIVLHFSGFSTIFYAIYKKQPKHIYHLSYPFAGRPSERSLALQCGPWAAGQRRSSQILANRRPGPAEHGRGRV
jgi:hypothetical protein